MKKTSASERLSREPKVERRSVWGSVCVKCEVEVDDVVVVVIVTVRGREARLAVGLLASRSGVHIRDVESS